MNVIHPSAVIYGHLKIADNVRVGPYCVLGAPSVFSGEGLSLNSESLRNWKSAGICLGMETVLESHVVVCEGTRIGDGVWCDHHTFIGADTVIENRAQIMYGARVHDAVLIGEDAWIGDFVCNGAIVEHSSIVLGKLIHKFVDAVAGVSEPSPIVRESAFVGMGAIIVGQVEVGRGAYIGAGAVLCSDAKPGRLYLGIPAKDVGVAPSAFAKPKKESHV